MEPNQEATPIIQGNSIKQSDEAPSFEIIPPHTHTPDEVSWDVDTDPNDPATLGHVMHVNDRVTNLSRRIGQVESANRQGYRVLSVSIIMLSVAILFVHFRQQKRAKQDG